MKHIIKDQHSFKQAIQHLSNLNIEKKYEMEIKLYVKKRTTSQNALMWMWLDEIALEVGREVGYDKDDMHEVFKELFLVPIKVIKVAGKEVKLYSTKKLNTKEMSEYMDNIERFAVQEWNVFVPRPEDLHKEDEKK